MSAVNPCSHCGHLSRFHRVEPSGYIAFGEWADKMCLTHHQEPCPGCGRFTIWKPGAAVEEDATP